MITADIWFKLLPWIAGVSALVFFILLMIHLKNLRYKAFQQEIDLGEAGINEKFDNISDDDILADLNKLEASSTASGKSTKE